MIKKTITRIIGATGTGKTYFAYQEACELVKNGEHVLFLSNFEDIQQGDLEKKYIKTVVDLQNIFIEALLMHKSYHVIFPNGELGLESSRALENNFLQQISHKFGSIKNTYLFIDEAQNIDEMNLILLLSEVKKYDIKLILIHQYFDQFSEKVQSDLDYFGGTGIYFQNFGNEIKRILEKYPYSGKTPDYIENLKQGQYIVLEK